MNNPGATAGSQQQLVRALWRWTRLYGYGAVLGISLPAVGIDWWQWQFWAVLIPVALSVEMRPNAELSGSAREKSKL